MAKRTEFLIEFANKQQEAEKTKENIKNITDNLDLYIAKATSATAKISKLTSYTDNYVSSQKVLNHTFGKGSSTINSYINSLEKMTGINKTTLSNSLALFGQMSKSMGMTTSVANDFSRSINTLSAKLSLLFPQQGRYEDFTKAMLDAIKGESSTLTTLTGIVVKTQSLQNTLDQLNIPKRASELNSVNYAMLQYLTVAKMVTASNKDLEKSANGVAFQKQILKNQIQALAQAFGSLLYPILQHVLPVLNGILMVVTNIINVFARLLGFNKSVFTSVQDNATAFDNLSSSIEKADKSANKSLRGFDKLNNITTPSYNAPTGGDAGIDMRLLDAIKKTDEQMLNIKNRATEIADAIMNWLGFTQQVNGEWDWSANKFLKNIFNSLFNIKNILVILAGLGIVVGISKIIKKIKEVKKETESVSKVTEKLSGAFQILSFGISGLMLLGGVALVIKNLNDTLEILSKKETDVAEVTKILGATFGIITGFMAATIGLSKVLVKDPKALLGLLALTTSIVIQLNTMAITLPIILEHVGNFITKVAPSVIDILNSIFDGISLIIDSIGNVFPPIIDSVGTAFQKVFGGMSDLVENVLKSILDFTNQAGPAINNLVDNIIRAVTKLINFIVSGIEFAINTTIINGVNSIIRAYNRSLGKLFEKIGFGGKIDTLRKASFPRFKPKLYGDGGFVDKGEVFIAREAGPEMIGKINNRTAVANNNQIVKGIENGVASGMVKALLSTGSKKDRPIYVKAQFGDEEITNWIRVKQNGLDRQFGY